MSQRKVWAPLRRLRDILALRGEGILIPVGDSPTGFRMVRPGDTVEFCTREVHHAQGTVLEVDHGAHYPVRVQWFTADAHMRISTYSPDEFQHVAVL